MHTRNLSACLFSLVLCFPAGGQSSEPENGNSAVRPESLPAASASRLPRWRGFNLPYRFSAQSKTQSLFNQPYTERPIRLISELGFNFIRLPLDYRFWIAKGDWSTIDEDSPVLREIDQVVEWGKKYGVHVCINFHRAPGYCINDKTPEGARLWTDPEAQRICAEHWAFFAKRYRGIPNERVSFNLWNEPIRTDAATHAKVARLVVEAIRAEDPDRLILCDGFDFKPSPELIPLGVAQAGRGYSPGRITHYRASWAGGSDRAGVPSWPLPQASGWLHAPAKRPETAGLPLVVEGPIPGGSRLRIRIGEVFGSATLVLRAGEKELLHREFGTGPQGQGSWKESEFHKQWNAFQCLYDQDVEVEIPEATPELRFSVAEGQWLQVTRLAISQPDQAEAPIDLESNWGSEPSAIRWDAEKQTWITPAMQDRKWLWDTAVQPWLDLAGKGVGVMIGEFGVYNKTPHDVTLAFLEDCLKNYREAGLGWALWNFDGSFGILDSERDDVEYEDWNGHKLDRGMLELLQRY